MSFAAFAVAAFFALVPAIGVGGALALAVLMCLAGALAFRPSLIRQALENRPLPLVLLVAAVLWAMTSTLWSPLRFDDQLIKLALLTPLGLMFAGAATADPKARRIAQAGGVAAVVILAILLAVEALSGLGLNQIAQPDEAVDQLNRNVSRGATLLVAMTWAAVCSLIALGGRARNVAAVLILAASGAVSLQFDQLANAIAFGAGLLAMAAGFAAPRLATLAISGGLAAWLVLAPFLTPLLLSNQRVVDALPLSWAARRGIWDFVSARILEQPWIGHGLEASRAVGDHIEVRGIQMLALPVHPHSASLQIWYETGAVGALLAAGALLTGGLWMSRAYTANQPAAAAACATLASLGLIANVSYGVWAEWWMATMFAVAALVGALSHQRAP
jgi:O-antigen ligase